MRPGLVRRPVVLLASASLVAGVGVVATVTAGTASPTPNGRAAVAPKAVPDQQVQSALDQLDTIVADIRAKSGVPGMSVAVTWKGETVYAKGFGVREVGKPALVTADTVFQLASVSKSVGATVIAREVGRGKVGWDTKVSRYLPTFALADPYVTRNVTVADMYAHRSGLREHAGDLLEDLGFTRAQVLHQLRLEALHPFRDEYAYTNFGMTAAGEAVARAAGTDWATLSQRDIYGPLDMTSTSSRFSDYISRSNRAVTHQLIDGEYVARVVRDPDAESPAGGASSSARDMARWLTMLLHSGEYEGQQVVSAKALQEAALPHMISSPATSIAGRSGFYGYGFNVDTTPAVGTRLSHSGAFSAGAATNYVALPGVDVGIVVLTNGSPVGAPEAVAATFSDLVQSGSITQDWWTIYNNAYVSLSGPTGALVGETSPGQPCAQPQGVGVRRQLPQRLLRRREGLLEQGLAVAAARREPHDLPAAPLEREPLHVRAHGRERDDRVAVDRRLRAAPRGTHDEAHARVLQRRPGGQGHRPRRLPPLTTATARSPGRATARPVPSVRAPPCASTTRARARSALRTTTTSPHRRAPR